ncbi:hypothetical protein COO60DRAFT_639271 [Scenedesmus sp. NREL 46B-D3]|nr:hypothetical protein COO60DRAFT_639271 [Scenedesmus sp. NREL 46B-D3]
MKAGTQDKQPVRGTLVGVDRAQTQAADLVTVQLQHGQPVTLKQNPTALKGSNVRVGACAWDGAYVLAAYLDAQPPGTFAGLRCVELGAGMGLVGLVAARLGAAVYLTDKPAMTVHARVNAAKNRLLAAATPAAASAVVGGKQPPQLDVVCPGPGAAAVVGLDWEDAAAAAAAAASMTAQGPIDLVVATDCIYPDPSGTVPSSSGFMAAVEALCRSSSSSSSKRTRVLVSFEARSDELRQALLGAAAAVPRGCSVQQIDQQQLPQGFRCSHIELYELKLGE